MSALKAGTSQTTTPLKRLALHSTSTCSAQASVYGKCILATYTDIRKDICQEEFVKFGECLRKAVSMVTDIATVRMRTGFYNPDETKMVTTHSTQTLVGLQVGYSITEFYPNGQ